MHSLLRPVRPVFPLLFVFVASLFTTGCLSKPKKKQAQAASGGMPVATDLTDEEKGKVVARIGDRNITLAELERRLNHQSRFSRSRYNTLERKREFLDSLVRFELLALDARAKGYDKDPNVVLAQKQAMVKVLTAKEIRRLVKLADITEDDVTAYYQEHIDQYDKPAEVRGSHILFGDETQARKVLAELRAKIAADKFKARDIFADYAKRYSEDKLTRANGGDMQFFGKPGVSKVKRGPLQAKVPPSVALAAFELKAVGDVAPEPVKSSQGWHLVQKTGFKRPYRRELADVRTSIRTKLFRLRKSKAMEDYVQRLKDGVKIEIDDAVLAEAKVERRSAGGAGFAPPSLQPRRPGLGGLRGKLKPNPFVPGKR